MAWYDSITDFASDALESVSEGAADWVSNVIDTELKEQGARPETNDAAGENVVFGDGKEAPTVTTTTESKSQIINGVDNKNLLLAGVGLIATIVLVKG